MCLRGRGLCLLISMLLGAPSESSVWAELMSVVKSSDRVCPPRSTYADDSVRQAGRGIEG
jgi:hypothetical protein